MPNEYSVMIHNYLTEKIAEAERGAAREKEMQGRQEDPAASPETRDYLQCRLTAVRDFHAFLRDNFHARLPRRLR